MKRPLWNISLAILLLSLLCEAQESQPQKARLGSISGHITIQGKLAQGVEVTLLPKRYHFKEKAIASTSTDANGRYEFVNLPANHYWVQVSAQGHVSPGNGDREGPGKNVAVADGEVVADADLDLIPGGTISGRVTDSTGNPVVDEDVKVSAVDVPGSSSGLVYFQTWTCKTEGDGTFKVNGVAPGRYLVSIGADIARLRGDVVDKNDYFRPFGMVAGDYYYGQTFYPGVTDPEQAHSVAVSAGEAVTGIDIVVGKSLPAYTASGRVIDAQTGKGLANARLELFRRFSNGGYKGATAGGVQDDQTDADGNFLLSGLIPGRFFMGAFLIESTSDLYSGRVDFEIKNKDISGLTIKVFHGLTVEGTLVIEGKAKDSAASKLAGLQVSAWLYTPDNDPIDMYRFGNVGKDGRFKVSGLRRGNVRISLAPKGDSQYFSIARLELPKAEDKTELQIVPVNSPLEAHLEMTDKDLKGVRVVLAYKDASIKGHVTVRGGRLPADQKLSISVRHPLVNGEQAWGESCDANGNFIIEPLEAGEYILWVNDGTGLFTETKTINVKPGSVTEVSFTVNLAEGKEH